MIAARAYIGIGSNLDQPLRNVRAALAELDAIPQTRLVKRSPLYRSEPVGPPGQPDYINAVAALDTELAPLALLEALQTIEQRHGRVRTLRWGPRTLDLDVLLYDDLHQTDPRLILPHPRLHERAFVLYPLSDIAPANLEVPGRGSLMTLLRECPPLRLERLEDATSPS
ncbi:MAG: 2-amino-4-hydroxy-6-hydroxymethyldihydropteridine diphosphokinase [Gammaproteobacteria bacterium]